MIDITIPTWPNSPERFDYFVTVIGSLFRYGEVSGHDYRVMCSAEAEHSPMQLWMGAELERVCREHQIELHWREAPPSLGANMNAALALCSSPTILLVQDDCPLIRPLDLTPGIEMLGGDRSVDMIRYEWPPQEHRTRLVPYRDGWRQFELVKRLYGDRAFMVRRDFMDRHGWFREGGPHGNSEVAMSERLVADRAVILAPDKQYFQHIQGHSTQGETHAC